MAENTKYLRSIPHMPFYSDILEQIDPESMEYIHSRLQHSNIKDGEGEELKVVRPYLQDTAFKINIYVF